MATDIFVKFDGIKGESQDVRHRDEIEVVSFSWGLVNEASQAPGGGGASGKADFHEFTFTHHIDRASPKLLEACATGKHIRDVVVTHRKAGGNQQEFIVMKMEDVRVTCVSQAGSPADTTEHVSLACGKVAFDFATQKADGSLDTPVHFGFDIKRNAIA